MGQSRNENILENMLGASNPLGEPRSREEALLMQILEKGGGGSSWTDLTGTLMAGQTSVTIQNASITTSSTIDYYTDVFGINPTNVVVTTGQVVLTFEAQSSNLGVKVRVS